MNRGERVGLAPTLVVVAAAFAAAYACSNYETGGGSTDGGGASSDDAASDGTGGDDATASIDGGMDSPAGDAANDVGSPRDTGGADACDLCPTSCCGSNETCVRNSQTDAQACATTCSTSSECALTQCCGVLSREGIVLDSGACISSSDDKCRCNPTNVALDCPSTSTATPCCAPEADTNGNPVGPYVCKTQDEQPYDCCSASTSCLSSGDGCGNFRGTNRYVCEKLCDLTSQCGGGAAFCNDFAEGGTYMGYLGLCELP